MLWICVEVARVEMKLLFKADSKEKSWKNDVHQKWGCCEGCKTGSKMTSLHYYLSSAKSDKYLYLTHRRR